MTNKEAGDVLTAACQKVAKKEGLKFDRRVRVVSGSKRFNPKSKSDIWGRAEGRTILVCRDVFSREGLDVMRFCRRIIQVSSELRDSRPTEAVGIGRMIDSPVYH